MSWILTYTGKKLDFENPQPDMICIEDIAHGLSNVCRFSGQCRFFYSVAQHSLLVAKNVSGSTNLMKQIALLHDATEAYMTDIPKPLKNLLPEYQELELLLWLTIAKRFNLPRVIPGIIKDVDKRLLLTERREMLPESNHEWEGYGLYTPYDFHIYAQSPEFAESLFLEQAKELEIK